jgi:CubicO group peptidase (beta-lactamase class C family)
MILRAWFPWLMSLLLIAAPSLAAPTTTQQRFEAFLAMLDDDAASQRAFVAEQMTAAMVERQGVDGLLKLFGMLHADLGDGKPIRVEARGDRIEAVFKLAAGGDLLKLSLKFAAPDARIDGIGAGPVDTPVEVPAVAETDLPKAIADAVDAAVKSGFSGAVIVARASTPLFAQAYGEADRASHRANTLDTPINLGSDNKSFTALVIARLVEQGKLAYDAPVGRYLPDWPQAEVRERVTLAHLLSHTSGLDDYFGPQHRARRAELDEVADYAELIKTQAPAAEPGKTFHYSNAGVVLLGLIAERVSGRDYYDLVRELVYRPAGMTRSDHYRHDDTACGCAVGYLRDGSDNRSQLAARGSPSGGGYASANDLLRFATALQAGRIVSPASLAVMTTRHADMGGPDAGYGFGVFRHSEMHYGHDGGAAGINASYEIFPESGYVVIVLANIDQGATPLAQQIGRLILKRTARAPTAAN